LTAPSISGIEHVGAKHGAVGRTETSTKVFDRSLWSKLV